MTGVIKQILRVASDQMFDVFAYCFMPDHLHALVAGTSRDSNFLAFVKTFKQQTGYSHKRTHGVRLWQRSYFDRTLREDETPYEAIRYIIANPVRAGLVEMVEEYEHWGSGVWTRQELLEYIATPDLKVRGSNLR